MKPIELRDIDLCKYIGKKVSDDKIAKVETTDSIRWVNSVSAFANTKGGVLVFGVSEYDVLIGLDDWKKDEEIIRETIKTMLDPRPHYDLVHFSEYNKDFIAVYLDRGEDTPYYVLDGHCRTAYVRIKYKSVPATRFRIQDLVLEGLNISYDTLISGTPKVFSSFDDFAGTYRKRTGSPLRDADLYSFGLMNKSDRLTNAGELVADAYTVDHSKIICTRKKNFDEGEHIEGLYHKEYGGSLTYLYDRAIDFIRLHTKKMWRKGIDPKINHPEYPEKSVEEAIVNALVHRDYRVTDDEIHIDIYDDRMEIYSPGGLPYYSLIQKENIYEMSSIRRNPTLADVFARMNMMERRGRGLSKIVEAYKSEEYYTEDKEPKFESTPTSFLVVLYNLNYKK